MITSDRSRLLLRAWTIAVAAATFHATGAHDARAQTVAPLQDRFLLGIGTHQGLGGAVGKRGYVPATSIKQMRELGVTSFRDDLSWSDFELPDRRIGFAAPLVRLEAQINARVAKPMLILGAGHHLVRDSDPPTTDEARQRFVDYAVAAARSVSDSPLFELWNEWNIATRKNPAFNAENYLALAALTYPAVKRISPNAPFVVGAIGDDPGWRWTASLLRGGLLKYADGISVHLYNHCDRPARRTSAEVIERLTEFHRLISEASGRPDFPIYVTETGWPTPVAKCGVNEKAQADNMAQLILWASAASAWLRGIWLYELKDSGSNPSELEDNFGLYHFGNAPKSSVCAVRDSWAFVRSGLKAEMMKVSNDVTAIKSIQAGGQRLAVWSNDPTKHYEIRLRGDAPKVSFQYPCDPSPKPAAGAWMTVSSTPLLVKADETSIPEFDVRPRDH